MAQHGGAMTTDDPELKAFLQARERVYGGFLTFVTWSIVGIVLLLILLAVFLL
ncbi:aa3-type cytochrome c oxidase subunit IV [Elioraea sp. Yellowstone]|jgi:hypothetical protein|uniref:aa3-type cytochrome c oxidase subunit IV n=1 Tax=Elioraea sp. Yellowstone TaxID=2592070 RepID=UPI00192A1CD5|nr:aa3-type cytochrome c oxidase subunit IV [Elioraea sp. Yellowstone]